MRNITCHTEVVIVVENTYRFQRKISFLNQAEADCAGGRSQNEVTLTYLNILPRNCVID